MTRAKELAKPEIAATNPAEIGWMTGAVFSDAAAMQPA